MYSFQAGAGRRRNKQTIRLLCVVIFLLVIALTGVIFAYARSAGVNQKTTDALIARAISEAGNAQNAVYRLTQSRASISSRPTSTDRALCWPMQTCSAPASRRLTSAKPAFRPAASLPT